LSSLSRFLFCHFTWSSLDGIFEKNLCRLVCFVVLVEERGGRSESEAGAELASEVMAELASDGRIDGGGWFTGKL